LCLSVLMVNNYYLNKKAASGGQNRKNDILH
jgi:hypothetical protein